MLARTIDVNKQLAKSQRIFDPSNEYKRKRNTLFPTDIENFGGRGVRGVTTSRFQYPVLPPPASRLPPPVLFCPFVSRLPPFIVFLPLSCKWRCVTPYSNSECFGLVQNKKWCCKSKHFALSSAIIETAFLRHKLTPSSKIFSVSWTTVVRSEISQ